MGLVLGLGEISKKLREPLEEIRFTRTDSEEAQGRTINYREKHMPGMVRQGGQKLVGIRRFAVEVSMDFGIKNVYSEI